MQLHQLKPKHKNKTKKRVGRGGKLGTFSTRGVKGQKSRAGARIRPAWRDLIKQIPKRKGYRFKPTGAKPTVVNLDVLSGVFKEGEIVSVQTLIDKEIIAKIGGRMPEVKILGDGEINKKLSFKGLMMSQSAKEKIEKAGGSIN